ncbi:MAG: apolipoprotein N-acyltransferase [Terriglobia bacterium]
MRSGPRVRWCYAASVLSGLLMVACFRGLHWRFLVWVAVIPLLVALTAAPRLRQALAIGYITGAVFMAGSCYWLVYVMQRYGNLGAALSVGVVALLALIFALFFAAFGLAVGWAAQRSLGWGLMVSPFAWVAAELARTYLITGFPWNLLGYAVGADGLRQLASVTAVYGLSFLAVATSAAVVGGWRSGRSAGRRKMWLAAASWVVLLLIANRLLAPPVAKSGPDLAYLLQPNVPLDEWVQEKWAPWHDPRPLNRLVTDSLDAVRSSPANGAPTRSLSQGLVQGLVERGESANSVGAASMRIIVWAENPAPFYFQRDPVLTAAMTALARQAQAYVVFNTVTFAGSDYTLPKNSAIVLDPSGLQVLQYDKIHLVPFGEYVPAWAFPGKIGKITAQVGDFVRGSEYRTAPTPKGAIGVFICYEDIFPQLVRRLTPAGPGVLASISNDSWYDDSPAAAQHLETARFRAIENRRYLLRATNDGITTVIDPYGRIVESLPRHVERVLSAQFAFVRESTFYTLHGDVFAWLCVAATLVMLARRPVKTGGDATPAKRSEAKI